MFLFVIALAIGLYLHATLATTADPASAGMLLAVMVLPKLAVLGGYALACRVVLKMLPRGQGAKRLRVLRIIEKLCHMGLLASYATDLRYGLLEAVRSVIGDLVLVDELLVMLPPLLAVVAMWAAFYPIDRRLREARVIADLDAGRPVHPVWTRPQFLISQVRHQIAFILVPLCCILAIDEALNFLVAMLNDRGVQLVWRGVDLVNGLQLLGAACVFLVAPVLIRHVWDTVPLPSGSLRERLSNMCQTHGIGYRQLLLWRTYGGMSNAAVMGIVKPLRYIMLTDALLENMTESQIEAVMAHEIAHVRKHHNFWLLAAAFAAISLLQIGVDLLLPYLPPMVEAGAASPGEPPAYAAIQPSEMVLSVMVLAGWYFIFGWVSRRFERQADTFAVQHLSQHSASGGGDTTTPGTVNPATAGVMIDALQHIAVLNHMPPKGRSWRHGSIVWRQDYLRSLSGQRLNDLAIDRTVRWIKLATAAALIATFAWYFWLAPPM